MKKELFGVFLIFLIILTSVSLFSYHAADPCVGNHFFTFPHHVNNQFGLIGAHVAGLFIYLFGIGSLWVPLILCLLGLWLIRKKSRKEIGLTLAGGLILIITTGSIFFLFSETYAFSDTTISAGGKVGDWLAGVLLKYANITGCVIFLCFFVLVGGMLVTGISLKAVLDVVWYWLIRLSLTIKQEMAEGVGYLRQTLENKREQRKAAGFVWAEKLKALTVLPRSDEKDGGDDVEADIHVPDFFSEPGIDANLSPKKINAPMPRSGKVSSPPKKSEPEKFVGPTIVEVATDDKEYVADPSINDIREKRNFILPGLSFLDEKQKLRRQIDTDELQNKASILKKKLEDFNVKGEVVEILPGPVITTFEYRPAPGIKLSKIVGLSDDLALALAAISIRIVAPIPGRDVVGIEIPNDERELVNLREMIASKEFVQSKSLLTLGLGKDLLGQPVATKMDKMPHLLIAGATGTGKSVGLNSMIISLLYKATPDEVKLIMIDPKRIELSVYNDIPHLITPVVTDMKKATNALFWAVREMDRRYELLELSGLRNIRQFNEMVGERLRDIGPDTSPEDIVLPGGLPLEKLPFIVVIVDELGDLMMVASKDVEYALTRLAQMARAAGIHLIIATQRPSADVLTGTIKANFPTRLSFQTSSKIDGRIIIDQGGPESLLGNGDMLFCPPGTGKLMRIQGAFISEKEIARVTSFLKDQRRPDYNEEVVQGDDDGQEKVFDESEYDEKYDEAVALVTKDRQASISYVQRRLRIGYNRAARLIEMMEHEGIVGPQIGSKPREILVRSYDEEKIS
ncbi:DNA translocase FtsK [Desulfobacter postgatei]|jgi:S-DNA-T family DNA segregation ATPase FtsK/SpoIIIE|uniref:DNA translocase FtsK n=1 Tax=Desulfobacter postgatei TaxID=2293 RepID=UPI002A35FE98|nr:DNA translocase FtsK [Desulfobacter postgatei]MDX9963083.1 DNA translocase FtsK [Desulfobacter postgatei]